MTECRLCTEEKWRDHYMVSKQRFDKVVAILTIGTIVAWMVTLACLATTIYTIVRFQAYLESIEMVEETEYEITQDRGINTAIIGSENEVILDGTDN